MNNGRIRKLDELVVNRIAAGEVCKIIVSVFTQVTPTDHPQTCKRYQRNAGKLLRRRSDKHKDNDKRRWIKVTTNSRQWRWNKRTFWLTSPYQIELSLERRSTNPL